MKASEIREKHVDELNEMLASLKEEQFNLRVQKSLGQLESSGRVTQVRKDIARVKTILTELKQKG